MLAITAVEEAELLLAVGRIVGGIDVEQNLPTLPDLVGTEADELLAQPIVAGYQIAGRRGVLPATKGGLGSECGAEFLIGNDLQHGVVTQTIGVVGIFVAGDNLINALAQQHQ